MSRKNVIEITLVRDELRKEAELAGLNEEQYLAEMKLANEKKTSCRYDIDVVDDWRASPPGYHKKYKMRRVVKERNYIVVALPYEIIKREASKRNMLVDQFIVEYEAVAVYNDSEYITYRFKKVFKE